MPVLCATSSTRLNDAARGLAQQMVFWGHDVKHPDRSLLLRFGFTRSPSTGLTGTSCYQIPSESGVSELHGPVAAWILSLLKSTKFMENYQLISCCLFSLVATAQGGLISLGGHVDLRWRWEGTNGWTVKALADSDSENLYDPPDFFLPLSDKPYAAGDVSNSGARFSQPASPAFAFTGVEPGQPLWIAVQGTAGLGEAWPGFENNQAASTFGSYRMIDPRITDSTPRPYITITLESYTPPPGTQSQFSMWSSVTASPPKVWMSTYDHSLDDQYLFTAGSHTHLNWGFSAPGIHRVRLKASAFLGPGQTNPTGFSDVETITFTVGPFADWQATHFSSLELDDLGISGPQADPDKDGVSNLVEFGFGLNPRKGSTGAEVVGLGLPKMMVVEDSGKFYEVVEYPARRAAGQIRPLVYQPKFSNDLSNWGDLDVITTESDFLGSTSHLNAVWKKVSARRAVGLQRPALGFARVGLIDDSP